VVDHVYNYLVDNNIRKLAKSNKKIMEYVKMIEGRRFIRVMEEYNEIKFQEDTKAQLKIVHYIHMIMPDADLSG